MTSNPRTGRSRLPQEEARQRYIEIGELVALEQIKKDSETLDLHSIAVGPFARLDANEVAARDGKTRGVISNLFGSQAVFQAETMSLALNSRDWISQIRIRILVITRRSAHGSTPSSPESRNGAIARRSSHRENYGSVWALWLSAVPYGLWSEKIRRPSMEEHTQWLQKLEQVLGEALTRFGISLRDGVTISDLACAFASLIEGVWLNQCMTTHHPADPSEPIATSLRRSGRLLWAGATEGNE